MSDFLELPLTSIEVGADRARPLDPAWVEGLAGSIREQGLMQPIVVRVTGEGYRLVAGHHRLAAFALLERETIPAVMSNAASDDEAKLAEVMENLCRNELIALDRCRHLYELKQLWEELYPQAKHGGDRKSAEIKSRNPSLDPDAPEVFGFVRSISEQIGLGQTQIRQAVKIWTGLAPKLRTRLIGTDTARKQTELKALSELAATKQGKVVDAILNPELPDISNVAQALAYLTDGIVCDPLEKRFQTVSRSIAALDDETFDSVIMANEDRVIASLQRRGRI